MLLSKNIAGLGIISLFRHTRISAVGETSQSERYPTEGYPTGQPHGAVVIFFWGSIDQASINAVTVEPASPSQESGCLVVRYSKYL